MIGADSYSRLDRALHQVAFSGIGLQKALADVEELMFRKWIESVEIRKPVFITSLPRAGTTLLLEVLSRLSDFASHTYRNMPFVLCPLLWDRISGGFRRQQTLRERAHGDGIKVGFDSPEAFEEVVWLAFWRKKYGSDSIETWSKADRDTDFETFFSSHMQKIVALSDKQGKPESPRRYLSKNNANVARLDLLPTLYPDCRILIPFRNPWDHVGSLTRQHRRFKEMHARDLFAKHYMEWLGHFEFGEVLRPINFRDWLAGRDATETLDDSFWLTYWAEAYETILSVVGPNVRLFDYDRSCAEPQPRLAALADWLELDDEAVLLAQASRFRSPTRYQHVSDASGGALQARVRGIYEALREASL